MSLFRRERGLTQRLFLISTENQDDKISYSILGSTGNVYEIDMYKNGKTTCTCPDYMTRKNICKHQYFIMDRVLKSKYESENSNDEFNAPEKIVSGFKKKKLLLEKGKLDDCSICMESMDSLKDCWCFLEAK